MAYKKKYATEEERRRAKSEAGKRGAEALKQSGNWRGGRKKGVPNKNTTASAEPVHSVQVRESAYKIFVRLAHVANQTLTGFMSKVAESLKLKNAKHFTDEPPVNM